MNSYRVTIRFNPNLDGVRTSTRGYDVEASDAQAAGVAAISLALNHDLDHPEVARIREVRGGFPDADPVLRSEPDSAKRQSLELWDDRVPLRTLACGSVGEHSSCLGTVMHRDYPRNLKALGPCECPCHTNGGVR